MIKIAVRVLTIAALATLATPLLGEEDFPLVGTYTENQVCKGDGSDSGVSRVKITARDIDSVFAQYVDSVLDVVTAVQSPPAIAIE